VGEGARRARLQLVIEPTRNAWMPLAAWFRARGVTVILVPPEQSADLRRYYQKHTKNDLLTELPGRSVGGCVPEAAGLARFAVREQRLGRAAGNDRAGGAAAGVA
jgi:hypothetical protein